MCIEYKTLIVFFSPQGGTNREETAMLRQLDFYET